MDFEGVIAIHTKRKMMLIEYKCSRCHFTTTYITYTHVLCSIAIQSTPLSEVDPRPDNSGNTHRGGKERESAYREDCYLEDL